MKRTRTGLLLAVLVLALWPGCRIIQEARWEKANAAGMEAYQQARYAEAERHFKAALKEAEDFGPDDERLATSLNYLAALYRTQGKYAAAKPLYQRSLAIREKALGPEHPDVALSLNNLAALYYAQGNYAQAEPLYQRALTIREKALGPEAPDVAQSLENYAALLRETRRDAEAEKLEARAQAIRAKHAKEKSPN